MGGIIWLASYPKSGNTWMRAFLHNLVRDPPAPIAPNRLTELTLGDGAAEFYQRIAGKPWDQVSEADVAALRAQVHRGFSQSSPNTVFVKTHNWLGDDHGLPCISMEYTAGAIYIVRNPLDTVISLADHFGISLDEAIARMADHNARTAIAAHRVPDVLGSWSDHVLSWTRVESAQMLVVRYEDLLHKPEQSFGRVVKFLGLSFPRARIDKAIRFSSFATLQKLEAEQGFVERSSFSKRFFRKGAAGQWRSLLSEAQVAQIVAAHGAQMARFGYGPAKP